MNEYNHQNLGLNKLYEDFMLQPQFETTREYLVSKMQGLISSYERVNDNSFFKILESGIKCQNLN